MRRVGVVERRTLFDKVENKKYTQWRLTSHGEKFLFTNLTASQQRLVDDTTKDGGRTLAILERVIDRYVDADNATLAVMMRRQWQYGYGQRRSRIGG